jgi:hypothetical protein
MSNTIGNEMIYHETQSENGTIDQKQRPAHVDNSMKASPGRNQQTKQTPAQVVSRL